MNFRNERRMYNDNSKKLRRARKLYKHLIAPYIYKNHELVYALAVRGVQAGLWSFNTAPTDIVYSMLSTVRKRFDVGGTVFDKYLWWNFKFFYKKTNSSYVQIKKITIRV